MKKAVLTVFNKFSGSINSSALLGISRQKFIAPVYHLASDAAVPHIKYLYPVRSVKQFSDDLDYLLRFFVPAGVKELMDNIRREAEPPKNTFFLSFDDGLRECYDTIAPVLRAKGIPGTFFLNSAFIDNRALFFKYKISILLDELLKKKNQEARIKKATAVLRKHNIQVREIKESMRSIRYANRYLLDEMALELEVDFDRYLNEQRPYPTTHQVQSLIREGHTIGAHSVDHPHYMDLNLDDQLTQTQKSIDVICERFALDYRLFAFPFTDFGVKKVFFQALFNENHPVADLSFGAAGIKKDIFRFHIQRFPMEGTLLPAKNLINTELLYYLLKIPFNKNNMRRT